MSTPTPCRSARAPTAPRRLGLAHPDDQPGLGGQPGGPGPGQDGQAAGVATPTAARLAAARATVSRLWLRTSGPGGEDRAPGRPDRPCSRRSAARPPCPGPRRRMAATVAAKPPAPPSARSSRATVVTTAWARPRRATASATRSGSPGIGGPRLAGVDQAEPAGPGAAVAVDHEGGRAVGPALEDVRAAGFLAHRHQVELSAWCAAGTGTPRPCGPSPAATRACARAMATPPAGSTPASASRPSSRTEACAPAAGTAAGPLAPA